MDINEQFERVFDLIEGLYTHTTVQFEEVKRDISELKTDIAVLKQDIAILKRDISELQVDVAELKVITADNAESIGGVDKELKRMNEKVYNHDLDIHLLKRAMA